ncbi:MAG: HK97 family phage prohead protease [Proteobacteria bacterium]|nr:HK97 family phage prohead protease [Pseudomonadota bacterium]
MTSVNFDTPFELKFLAATGVFEGYASVFNVTDSVNDQIMPGAFKNSLDLFRQENRMPPLLWQHNTVEPIGAWREMHEDGHGLFVKGDLFIHDIPLAKEAYKLLKENVVTGLSIGYRTVESHIDQKSGVRVLTQLDLLEVSLVTFPANSQARVLGVKNFFDMSNIPSEREFETFLHSAGFSRKQAKGVVAKGYRALAMSKQKINAEAGAVLRLRASLIQATEENRKAALALAATPEKKSTGFCEELRQFSAALRRATRESEAKYSPDQPRDNQGRWTGEGGGESGSGLDPGQANPVWGLDVAGVLASGMAAIAGGLALGVEAAVGAAEALGGLYSSEADAVGTALTMRSLGSTVADALDFTTSSVSEESAARISDALQGAEDFLGGTPENSGLNKYSDFWAIKGDNKIHFDVYNPGEGFGGISDQPHFHLETLDENGEYIDAGSQHRYYFKKE